MECILTFDTERIDGILKSKVWRVQSPDELNQYLLFELKQFFLVFE